MITPITCSRPCSLSQASRAVWASWRRASVLSASWSSTCSRFGTSSLTKATPIQLVFIPDHRVSMLSAVSGFFRVIAWLFISFLIFAVFRCRDIYIKKRVEPRIVHTLLPRMGEICLRGAFVCPENKKAPKGQKDLWTLCNTETKTALGCRRYYVSIL